MNPKPPHLLIVLHRLGTGGVERVTMHLANGLAARGNRVTLVLLSGDGALEGQLDASVQVVRPLRASVEQRGPGLLRAAGPIAKLIRSERPDVLLSPGNHTHLLALAAHRLARRTGSRLAIKVTNAVERERSGLLGNALRRAFFRHAARRADTVLVLSEQSRAAMAALAPASAPKLQLVRNPYIKDRLLKRRSEAARDQAPPLLLSAGRFTAQKNPLLMLRALARLRDRPWRLAMLGEGPLREACVHFVAKHELGDRVDFPGFVADPAAWFDRATLFLLSSDYEELPAVLFEAAAAGCALISTTASPAVADLLKNGAGRLVPTGDVDAFRSAVADALDDPSRPAAPPGWLRGYSVSAGVASHAEALGLL